MKFEGNKVEIDYSLKNYIMKKGEPQVTQGVKKQVISFIRVFWVFSNVIKYRNNLLIFIKWGKI